MIRTLTASVLLENRQARGLLAAVRPNAIARYADGASTYRFPVNADARGTSPAMHGVDQAEL